MIGLALGWGLWGRPSPSRGPVAPGQVRPAARTEPNALYLAQTYRAADLSEPGVFTVIAVEWRGDREWPPHYRVTVRLEDTGGTTGLGAREGELSREWINAVLRARRHNADVLR